MKRPVGRGGEQNGDSYVMYTIRYPCSSIAKRDKHYLSFYLKGQRLYFSFIVLSGSGDGKREDVRQVFKSPTRFRDL